MPGPQTQHKGTVYGDDENAPKPGLFFSSPARGGRCLAPPEFRRTPIMRVLVPRLDAKPTDAITTDAITRFYLQYGHHANAHSVAFDPDFERYVSPLGVVAYARCAPLGTTMCYFEPLCAAEDLPALVDEWLVTMQGEHVGFWKASRLLAEVLARHPRGFHLAAYGIEHEVDAPPSLAGSAMRGLRRQVDKARNAGVVVTPIPADTGPGDPVRP